MHNRIHYLIRRLAYASFFITLIALILTNSAKSLYYAFNGLNLWFQKMIPALFPFMVLSGSMVRLQLTEGFASLFHPFISPLYRVRKNVTYAMFMGFLCGFPMGAKVTCDLLERNMITRKEAEFLLSFCNNIGPVYFLSFVLPLLRRKILLPYLIGMYAIPLLYGLIMRHTRYCDLDRVDFNSSYGNPMENKNKLSILDQIDEAITASLQSILNLGGYMIFFNLLNLIPEAIAGLSPRFRALAVLLAPLLEITGGLSVLGDRLPFVSLILLPFGGMSCIAQTQSIIRRTGLSITCYIQHKLILAGITFLYYMSWKLLSPGTFLK